MPKLYDWTKLVSLTLDVYNAVFSQFVLENSSREDKHECPFARSSIQLTLILCEILRIGEPRKLPLTLCVTSSQTDSKRVHVMFFCFL